MQRCHVFRAWKWLLVHHVIAASIGYIAVMLVAGLWQAKTVTLLKVKTFDLPHLGTMITNQGIAFGIDASFMLFFCNLTGALLIVGLVYWAQLFNPHNRKRSFLQLRRYLQEDRSAEHLRKIDFFARIQSPQLRMASFLLLAVPYSATIALGLSTGAWVGVLNVLNSSPVVALAYILPHGIPEIAAMLLACSIPVGTWMTIRPIVGNESTSETFRSIDGVLASQQFQQNLKMIITLLLIASLIEGHLTLKVVSMLSGI